MKRYYLFALTFIGMLASCSSNDATIETPEPEVITAIEEPVPIKLSAGGVMTAEATSRAAITSANWVGTKVGVCLVPRAGLNSEHNLQSAPDWGFNESFDPTTIENGMHSIQTWGSKTMLLNKEAIVQSDGTLQFTSAQFYPPTSEYAKYTLIGLHPTNAVIQTRNTTYDSYKNTYPNRLNFYYDITGYNDIMFGMAQEDYDSAYSAAFQKATDVTKDGVATGKSGDELRPKIKFNHLLTKLNFLFRNATTNTSTEPVYIDSVVIINQYNNMVIHVDIAPYLDENSSAAWPEITNKDTLTYWWEHGSSTRTEPISLRDEAHHDSLLLENVITEPEVRIMYQNNNPDVTSDAAITAGTKALRKTLMAEYAVPLRGEEFKKIGGSMMILSQYDHVGTLENYTGSLYNISDEALRTFEMYVYTRTYDQTIGYADAGTNGYKQNFKGDGQHTHARALVTAPGEGIFEPGKAYNIKVSLGSNTEIKVDAELTEWVNGGDVEVDAE